MAKSVPFAPPALVLEDLILEYPKDPFWDGAVISFPDLQHRPLFDPWFLLPPQRHQQEGWKSGAKARPAAEICTLDMC